MDLGDGDPAQRVDLGPTGTIRPRSTTRSGPALALAALTPALAFAPARTRTRARSRARARARERGRARARARARPGENPRSGVARLDRRARSDMEARSALRR